MEVKRKQKFVRLKFGKVKLWSKAPSFYRVHPTHLPSGFGHAVVQRPHSALPNLTQRRTEVYFKYQQLKNHISYIIFLHTLSYIIIHVFHSHGICFKKKVPERRNAWNWHVFHCHVFHYHVWTVFGPCFLAGKARCWCVSRRWRASDSLGKKWGRCGEEVPKKKRSQNSGEFYPTTTKYNENINEIQMQQIGSCFGTPASAASLIEFSNSLAIQLNTMNLGESKRKVLTCSILREFCLQPSSSLEHLSFLLLTHPSFSGHICLNNFASSSGFKS